MRGKDVLRAGVIAGTTIAACSFQPTLTADANQDGGLCMSASTECVEGSDILRTCPSAGAMYSDVNCAWGCTANGQVARCLGVVPSGSGGNAMNGVRPDDVAGGSDLANLTTLPADTILDGDSGKIGTGGNPTSIRGPGPGTQNGIDYEMRGPIAMFRVNSLVVAGNITLVGSHSIALVAIGQVEIDGVIDGTGACIGATPGPGGFAGGLATKDALGSGGGSDGIAGGGGGGGGYGGNGGGGGYLSGAYSVGGSGWGAVDLASLHGGGGGGGAGAGNGGIGGGGGGAVQIVSNQTIAFGPVGGVNVGGCGGHHVTTTDPGGGGGAGGGILLEAPTIVVGNLAANGGGGGAGDIGGTDGTPGQLSSDPAPGGATATGLGGAGGAGGAGNSPNGSNAATGPGCSHCGGGGGSVGRIRLNTRNGTGVTNGPATSTSPSASTGSAAVQ